jgi:hypothetical protein
LEYDITTAMWISAHHDLRIQRMAECFVESHLCGKNLASSSESEQPSE